MTPAGAGMSRRLRAALLCTSLLGAPVVSADLNVTVDDLDRSAVFTPLEAWAWSDQGNGVRGGSFSFTNQANASVVFTFPQNATGVSWQGFKRSGPAFFSVCIDCDLPTTTTTPLSQGQTRLVDGHDSNEANTNTITTLFSMQDLSCEIHTLRITNLVDPRFSQAGQLTVDSFTITKPDWITASPSTQQPAQTSSPIGPSATSMQYSYSSSSNSTVDHVNANSGISKGAIAGLSVATFIAVLLVVGIVWFLRKRARKESTSWLSFLKRHSSQEPASPMMKTLNDSFMDLEKGTKSSSRRSLFLVEKQRSSQAFAPPFRAATHHRDASCATSNTLVSLASVQNQTKSQHPFKQHSPSQSQTHTRPDTDLPARATPSPPPRARIASTTPLGVAPSTLREQPSLWTLNTLPEGASPSRWGTIKVKMHASPTSTSPLPSSSLDPASPYAGSFEMIDVGASHERGTYSPPVPTRSTDWPQTARTWATRKSEYSCDAPPEMPTPMPEWFASSSPAARTGRR